MSKDFQFPLDFIDKINSPEREKLLRFLDSSQKLEAEEVNEIRDAINALYDMVQKAGLDRQKAEHTTKPFPTGFWRYSISSPGTYIYFLDIDGKPIEVTSNDLSQGIVEIWVNNGISEKVIQYINIEDQVIDEINNIIGENTLQIFIESTRGNLLIADDLNTTLIPSVQRYFKDFNDQVTSWQWYRESGSTQEDHDSDEIWSLGKNKRILDLTTEDFTLNVFERAITFTCIAIVAGEKLKKSFKVN